MIGGLERSVENAHLDLNQAGHFCRVVTPSFKGADRSDNGVLRVASLKGFGERDFSIPLPTSSRMEHWIEAIDPHLLHSHQPFLLGDTAWRVSRLRRIPLIFSHHTLYERYAHYLPMDVERAERLVIDLSVRYANRSHMVIAPTASIRSLLLERGVAAPIEIAPSGIDWELYAKGSRVRGRQELSLAANAEVIGHVGRLSQEKNLRFLVESLITLMKKRTEVMLLLVGDGDCLQWARERFEGEQLGDRVVCPGMLSGTQLANAYAAMDLFVFSSLTDTQGLVLAEAMAAHVPIIALDAPGPSDCVRDGANGRLVPLGSSPADFASEVVSILADKPRLATLATHAHESSRAYARSECLRRLVSVYEQTLEQFVPSGDEPLDRWDQVAERFDVEWTPFWEKVTTAFRALSAD